MDTFFLRVETIPELSGLSPEELHQKLILASIVEREYRVAEEAPLIASVFTNRLKIDMGLYSCATIEYIITEIEGKPHPNRITYQDLESVAMDLMTLIRASKGLPNKDLKKMANQIKLFTEKWKG